VPATRGGVLEVRMLGAFWGWVVKGRACRRPAGDSCRKLMIRNFRPAGARSLISGDGGALLRI